MALTRKQKATREQILRNIYTGHRRKHAVVSWDMLGDQVRFGSNSPRTARRLQKKLEPRGYLVSDDLTIKLPPALKSQPPHRA